MKNNQVEIKGPKDAVTSEGPNAKAMGAIALIEGYTTAGGPGKENWGGPAAPIAAGISRARAMPRERAVSERAAGLPNATFCDSAGRKWAYRGKRARVLGSLAMTPAGSSLPWHTRLGGAIHATLRDGLAIDAEREGEYRYARYRLRAPGSLIIHPENTGPGGEA